MIFLGGPITKDNTAVEYYATIFAACESPYEEGLLWAASDDGLIHISKDSGNNWENVTPKNSPTHIMWNSVDPDPFVKGGLYVAGTLYKTGDYKPYLYKTKDYGKSWEKIDFGIQKNHFTRVLNERESVKRERNLEEKSDEKGKETNDLSKNVDVSEKNLKDNSNIDSNPETAV